MDIKESVLGFFAKQGIVKDLNISKQFEYNYVDNGALDSAGIVEMITEFEESLGIQFSTDDFQSEEFQTIGGLVGIIERLRINND